MSNKLLYEDVKAFIDKEDKLISTEYHNTVQLLDIQCHLCNDIYKQTFYRYQLRHGHPFCKHRHRPRQPHARSITCTKEFIINYLSDYYIKTGQIPIVSSKEHPFSKGTVVNRFGSLNQALIESNVPSHRFLPVQVHCHQCNITFKKAVAQIKKSLHNFCSRSCSATYTNKHRTSGTNVSKLEIFLQQHLSGYNFIFNERLICDGLELDIYIPELQLAFEINGIVHYKPIYGEERLKNIIRKDLLKRQMCIDQNIKLIVIKDDSNVFSIRYATLILERIYFLIHKHKMANVFTHFILST